MKITLTSELDARRHDGQWVIDEEFVALVEEEDGEVEIRVPAGFVTDFASVPRMPLAYWLAGDTAHEAAVLHDYCYCLGTFGPRAWCDRMFAAAMDATGVPAWRRALMYAGVRAGGWAAWNNYRRKEQDDGK